MINFVILSQGEFQSVWWIIANLLISLQNEHNYKLVIEMVISLSEWLMSVIQFFSFNLSSKLATFSAGNAAMVISASEYFNERKKKWFENMLTYQFLSKMSTITKMVISASDWWGNSFSCNLSTELATFCGWQCSNGHFSKWPMLLFHFSFQFQLKYQFDLKIYQNVRW